ncbi:MAG: type 1 glutamine amidotransferase [Thiotrichaceae bacterium]|nr:type 1 glutamine amidotransferase [Thiotrichaceae bacterium]PCI12259.1 MAG: amidotransferase [Thiotrichales bacterium]
MKVHYLQHVPFEGLGSIKPALIEKGYQLSSTHLYADLTFPLVSEFDWLIVMGGPMGIYDDETYPWLVDEKNFIKAAIDAGKVVLGICLGAQLIADVLGAKVYRNEHREIGWFNIDRLPDVDGTVLANALPHQVEVFHWHGDTFDIPEGAVSLAQSDACARQGFIFDNRVVGFQFHLETTAESAAALIEHCGDELNASRYVQSETEIIFEPERFSAINAVMLSVLNALEVGRCNAGSNR